MPLFGAEVITAVRSLIAKRSEQLHKQQGEPGAASPLERDLKLLVRVANGELARSDVTVRRVEVALAHVLDGLLANALGLRASPPDGFWQSDIGVLLSRARWWVSVDDLITISAAAAFAFGENNQANRMRISRAIDSGVLEWLPDPSVSNPQQNRRVLLSQVERLRDLKRLPE
jgi:hypothetical protein